MRSVVLAAALATAVAGSVPQAIQITKTIVDSNISDREVKFNIYLENCNVEALHAKAADISSPTSNNFRKYMTTDAVHDMTKCADYDEKVARITALLHDSAADAHSSVYVTSSGNTLTVKTTAATVEKLVGSPMQKVHFTGGPRHLRDYDAMTGLEKPRERVTVEDGSAVTRVAKEMGAAFITGLTGGSFVGKYKTEGYRAAKGHHNANADKHNHGALSNTVEALPGRAMKKAQAKTRSLNGDHMTIDQAGDKRTDMKASGYGDVTYFGYDDDGQPIGGYIPGLNDSDAAQITQFFISPNILRQLYNVDEEFVSSGLTQQGVAAFTDWYIPADLCTAAALLGTSETWASTPDIKVITDIPFNSTYDQVESELDTQYITAMGQGIPTIFLEHGEGEWVLDFASQLTSTLSTVNGTNPSVWSVSYGFPEMSQCLLNNDGLCGNGTASDSFNYIMRTEEEFAKTTLLGMSIFISSGDDGNIGYGATAPNDPLSPITVLGGNAQVECPYDDISMCQCATLEAVIADSPYEFDNCILPVGPEWMGLYQPGVVACTTYFQESANSSSQAGVAGDCRAALEQFGQLITYNDAYSGSATFTHSNTTCRSDIIHLGDSAEYTYVMGYYSDCQCSSPQLASVTVGSCTIRPYVYNITEDVSLFAPDYPTSSAYVTSVGATQLPLSMDGPCEQSDLWYLSPVQEEHAVSAQTGNFDAGGGFSNWIARPSWQADLVDEYLQAYPNLATIDKSVYMNLNTSFVEPLAAATAMPANTRAYPDLSANGAKYTVVYQSNGRQTLGTVGGTSASAPALAGMIALLNELLAQNGQAPVGFMNPMLYSLAANNSAALVKVGPYTYTSGGMPFMVIDSLYCSRVACSEYGFAASTSGFDAVNGLGTIDWAELATAYGVSAPGTDDDATPVDDGMYDDDDGSNDDYDDAIIINVDGNDDSKDNTITMLTVAVVVLALLSVSAIGVCVYFFWLYQRALTSANNVVRHSVAGAGSTIYSQGGANNPMIQAHNNI